MPEPELSSAEKRDLLAPFRKRISRKEDVFRVTAQYTELISELLIEAAAAQPLPYSLFAAGSLARNELLPFTAIDLLIAYPSEEIPENAIAQISIFEGALKRSGQKLNFEFISPATNFTGDVTLLTKTLEAKFLFGDKQLFASVREKCMQDAGKRGVDEWIDTLCDQHTERFRKYDSSPETTEPNVKLSPGGLRDLHTMYWVALLSGIVPVDDEDYISVILNYFRGQDLLPEELIASLPVEHKEVLYARYALFRKNLKKADRLEIPDQQVIASRLHLKGEDAYRVYMADFFRATVMINNMMYALKKQRIELLVNQLPDSLRIPLDDQFSLKGGLLFFRSDLPMTMADAVKACQYQADYQIHLSQSCRRQMLEIPDDNENNLSGETLSGFRKLFMSPKSIAAAIQSMNELRIFGKIIPQFTELQGFSETGAIHYYAADEHTIKALVHFEEMEDMRDLFGKVFQFSRNKELCRIALLFHDLAKPVTISGYPLLSSELASVILERFGFDEEFINAVTFLIKKQLLLRDYAFDTDSMLPKSVDAIVDEIPSVEALHHLFLITYADLSAVNPSYWTSWKQELLIQVFLKIRKLIEERESAKEAVQLPESGNGRVEDEYNSLQSEHLAHLHAMNDSEYFSRFTDAEIGEHIREISLGKPLSVLWSDDNSETRITVIAKESPYLLSNICGVLAINELNILAAMIFTRQDGIAIHTFTVTDPKRRAFSNEEMRARILENLSDAINDVLQVGIELTQARARWRAIEKRIFKKKENIKISFIEDDKYTVIEVFAPDRVGLLYHVTKKMSDLGLVIYFAKINTRHNEISDVFYALDRYRKKVTPNFYNLIENELKELLENLV